MTDWFSQIDRYVRTHHQALFDLLEELVVIPSGSREKSGVDRVGQHVQSALSSLPVAVEVIHQHDTGDHLVVRTTAARSGQSGILLVGHMDTVFGKNASFNGYWEDLNHSYGPGVIDMKGGVAATIMALAALHDAKQLSRLPITAIFNADEEIGSPTSRALIHSHALKNRFALVMECGGLDGQVVTGRKGNASAILDLRGQAGHAAFAGPDKASAILALAHMTVAIEALNDPESSVSTNVGVISGGTTPNTVAESATASIDMRFVAPSDHTNVLEQLEAIAASCPVAGVDAQLTIRSSRPPMPATDQNKALFEIVRTTADQLNMQIEAEFRQGVSDANIIAAAGTPVIDGLGPIGALDHSDKEYMIKSSLVDRTILLACAIVAGWDHF